MHHVAVTTNSNQLASWNEIPVEKKIKAQLVKKIPKTVQETPSYSVLITWQQTQSYFNSFNNTFQSSLISSGLKTINS